MVFGRRWVGVGDERLEWSRGTDDELLSLWMDVSLCAVRFVGLDTLLTLSPPGVVPQSIGFLEVFSTEASISSLLEDV